jgi:outer membrane lipoprotein SlyB
VSDRQGIEYTIDLDNGVTVTIVQEIHKRGRAVEAWAAVHGADERNVSACVAVR